jgi:two-component system cell cycle sensor histidine kinase/response regulator CckA
VSPAIRILYAEDNPQDADLTRDHFAQHAPDFDIEMVDNGQAFVERLGETGFDVLLLDHHLPDMDGLDVLKTLFRTGLPAPLVMVTGVGDDELVVKALRMGATSYVSKQGNYLETLPDLLRDVIAEHRQRRRQSGPTRASFRRILYVEKNEMDIELTQHHFADVAPQFTVDAVRSAPEALELLHPENAYDLVLLDLWMPDLTGIDFVREARRRGLHLPPFIIVTGKGEEHIAIAALKLGAADYIVKRDGYLNQLPHVIEQAIAYSCLKSLNEKLQGELEAHKRARTILDAMKDLFTVVDAHGMFTEVNGACRDFFGKEPSEVLGAPAIAWTHPDDRAATQRAFEGWLRDRVASASFENRQVCADGTVRHVSWAIMPQYQNGNLHEIWSIGHDITQRKQAEDVLRESEVHYRTIFENAVDCIFESTEDGRALAANPAFVRLLGYASEADVLRSLTDLPRQLWAVPEERDRVRQMIEEHGSAREYECELVRKDGAKIPVALNATASRGSDGLLRFHGSFVDITERKRAETALRDSERKLSSVMESMRDVVWSLSWPDMKVLFISPSAEQMFGRPVQQFVQRMSLWQEMIHPEDAHATEAALRELQDTGKARRECRVIRPDGTMVWVHDRSWMVFDETGQPVRVDGIVTDITERKRAEQELKESKQLIESVVENVPLMIFLKDAQDLRFVVFNKAGEELLGYDRHDMIGKNNLDLFPPEQAAFFMAKDREVLAACAPVDILEEPIQTAKRGQRLLHTKKVCIKDSDGAAKYLLGISEDVTERRQTERALEQHRHHLEELVLERTKEIELFSQLTFVSLESASVGAWWINFEEEDTFHALDTTAKMIGVPISRAPDKAYRISNWVQVLRDTQARFPEYAQVIESTLDRFAGTISGTYERYRAVYPVALPGEAVKWIDARADVSARAKDGSAIMMTGTLIDITQLMEAEKKLTEHKAQLETLVGERTEELAQRNRELQMATERLVLATRAAVIGVWDWDIVRNELVWDDAMYRLYGVRRGDFGGAYEAWLNAIHPDDRLGAEEAIQAALRGDKEYAYEFRVVWPDGSVRYLQASSLTFREPDGRPTRMVGVNLDTTERRATEAALRENEARFRAFLEQAPVPIAVWKLEGTCLYANQTFLETLGLKSIEQVQGRPATDFFAPQFREQSKERTLRRLHGLPVPPAFETVLQRADGTEIPVHLAVAPIRLSDETVSISFLTDLSERQRLEANRSQLEEQLRVSQKMEAIGSLAGGVAHDFNNLLSVILNYTEFAMEALQDEAPIKEDLLEVKKAGERAVGLTRQLLAFGRKQVLQPVALDLNHITQGVEKMLGRILGEDIDLVQILAPDLGLTLADPGQIEQVLMNLVVNARDAMPQGGKLTIETSNVQIDEEYATRHVSVTPGSYVQLAVTDTGTGMDKGTQARLFEPFFTTKEKGRGTGLGLSTVYGIVKQSGGDIWVYSELGRGTTFKIFLPRSSSDAAALEDDAEPTSRRSGGVETILVVEDEEALRKVALRSLLAAGYKVLTAADGDEALLLNAKHTEDIDLLLTDVVMPRMSGRVLAEQIAKARPTVKVLYMSGYTDNAIVHHGVLDPGTHFLPKPFTSVDLTRKVRDVLDARVAGEREPDSKDNDDIEEQPLGEDALRGLPAELLSALRRAITAARWDELVELIETLRMTEPVLATGLRRMADHFDSDGLRRVVDQQKED